MKNNMLLGSLGLSIAVHAAIFLLISMPNSPLKPPPFKKPIEVAYRGSKSPAISQKNNSSSYKNFDTKKQILPNIKNLSHEDALTSQEQKLIRENRFKEDTLKKSVNLPNIPGEIFKTPEYKSYYQIIREKIRRLAYSNYKKLNEGEVFLTFSLNQDGQLLNFSINQERSTPDQYLSSIAEKSIEEASPYPPFPEKLKKNKSLLFNVIISFEIK